jgi:hypothetical protein
MPEMCSVGSVIISGCMPDFVKLGSLSCFGYSSSSG